MQIRDFLKLIVIVTLNTALFSSSNHERTIHLPNADGLSPLHIAARANDLEMLKYLLKQKKILIDIQSIGLNQTALHFATINENKEAVELLISNNARINIPDCSKMIPIHYAAKTANKDITLLLLTKKKYLNIQDIEGKTIAHWAIQSNCDQYIDWLFSEYTDINLTIRTYQDQLSPLHYAIYFQKNIPLLYAMLFNKEAIAVQDEQGRTPLDLAKDLELESFINLFESCKI